MLSQEEATKILMEELGYKYIGTPSFSLPCYSYIWINTLLPVNAPGRMKNDSEALAHCLDLNVHTEIWKIKYWLVSLDCEFTEASIMSMFGEVLAENIKGKTIQEACFYATAEAIRKEK